MTRLLCLLGRHARFDYRMLMVDGQRLGNREIIRVCPRCGVQWLWAYKGRSKRKAWHDMRRCLDTSRPLKRASAASGSDCEGV